MDLTHTVTRGLYRRYRACSRYFLARPATPLAFAFFGVLRVANRLTSRRRVTPSQAEANRIWTAAYVARYGTTPPYRLETDCPIALASPDHQWPRGTILDSSVNRRFNLKLYEYFRRKPDLLTLDIGCAGGGFVKSLLEEGYEAVGIEGSDISQRLRSREWDTIPYHLFTADATGPFSFVDRTGQRVRFDCITAWEVLEHIAEERLGGFMANIAANLAPNGIFVGSIALFPDGDPLTGAIYHVTLHEPDWWLEHFRAAGLEPVRDHPFRTEDYVRGHGRGLQDWDPADGDGIHVVMRKRDDARPEDLGSAGHRARREPSMTATGTEPRPEDRFDQYLRWRDLSGPYFDWQVEQFRPFLGRRIADVGCGPGTMTALLAPSRELYLGVDRDPGLLEALQHAHRDVPSIEVFVGDVTTEACRDRLLAERVDTIVCSNLIEHIDDDVLALRRMAEALPIGRYLCLLVPAFPVLYGTLDTIDGHRRRYTKAMLRDRVRHLPLTIRRLYYFNSVGAIGWLLKGRVLKEQRHGEENFRLMNVVARALRPVERVVAPPFGISLIAILQRRSV